MLKIVKRISAFLLFILLAMSLITPALSGAPVPDWRPVPTRRLPDGVVGEPYAGGRIRFRHNAAETTWDIWEGNPPPPIWSTALYERGLDAHFSPDYSHSDPWDLPMIEESWYGTLPPGLFLDHIGGLVHGTPTERGKYLFYAPSFREDGTQNHVPFHYIKIKERLATPEISIRTVRNSVLQWPAVPDAEGYYIYVNGLLTQKIGLVTSYDLDRLGLTENSMGYYTNLVAVSSDWLLIDSDRSNAEHYFPGIPGLDTLRSTDDDGLVLSAHAVNTDIPQTSVHNIFSGSFIAMCISIFATLSLGVYVFFYIRKVLIKRG